MAVRSKRKSKARGFFDSLDETCKDYGAELLVNEHWIEIKFKDGKHVTYALPFDSKSKLNNSAFHDMVEAIESGFQGRVFDKDNNFINYAPTSTSVAEMLVAVDMML